MVRLMAVTMALRLIVEIRTAVREVLLIVGGVGGMGDGGGISWLLWSSSAALLSLSSISSYTAEVDQATQESRHRLCSISS